MNPSLSGKKPYHLRRFDRPADVGLKVFSCLLFLANNASAQDPVSAVVVSTVVEARISSAHRVIGSVQPLRTSTIGSAIDGRVVEFLIDEGTAVTEGQPLARLRTETLEIELAAARAEFEFQKQQLAELKNGELPETIQEAKANMLMAKSAMDNSKNQLRRIVSLSASNAATESDVENARTQEETARQAFAATTALLKRITDGARVERIAQADAQVELHLQKIKLIEDRIAKHTIVSPFDGFVSAENTEVGAWISQGDPVCQVIQLDEIEIHAPTTAEYAVQLRRGDDVRVEFPELPEQLFTGTVDRIVPVAESRARTFPVYVRMKNEIRDGAPILMAGMLARVELPAGERKTLPLVPKDSLVLNGEERAIFVVEMDSTTKNEASVRKVLVDLGVAIDGLIQVKGDVKKGDLVVIVGNERLTPGRKVEVVKVVEPDSLIPATAKASEQSAAVEKETR